ncbi:hypothetical protein O6H91_02G003900 [Diphasiastrum complanatum]|uniref:Uncharacterized protein n=1 Tax=Diphasiastrum complanatum TaxID=34168 RepID=A0ACC2EC13_DIPCM|nr:hypothetical protein O6H91_02G003900 [Diphasiastrum complanatum]
MTKLSLKGKHEAGSVLQSAAATLSLGAGDVKLKASCTDTTFINGPSLTGVSIGVEKPGLFIIDYDLPSKAARFQFMSSTKLAGKQIKLTYIHPQKRNATLLEGSFALDPRNKLTAKYSFASEKAHLKYSYVHGSDTTLEPSYDFGTNSWNFSASRNFSGGNALKAVYESSHRTLGLEFSGDDKETGPFKVSATVHVAENRVSKLILEKTWNYEL